MADHRVARFIYDELRSLDSDITTSAEMLRIAEETADKIAALAPAAEPRVDDYSVTVRDETGDPATVAVADHQVTLHCFNIDDIYTAMVYTPASALALAATLTHAALTAAHNRRKDTP